MATLWAMTVLLGCVGHPAAPPESSSTKPAAAMTPEARLPGDRIAARTFIDQQRGWAVGTSAGNGSLIERTLDGGDTWTVQLRDDEAFPLAAVSFTDDLHGWAVGGSGTLVGYGISTEDGGRHWSPMDIRSGPLESVRFSSVLHGTITGWDGDHPQHRIVLTTDDGGAHWMMRRSK